jgi:iron complex outermembrane receptor protein
MRKLFAVALTALWFSPLFAQTSTPQPPPDQKKDTKVDEEKKPKVTEEMVVTARKREETVQEVPESVAAPTESELRDRGAQTLEDVAANVAGFTVQNLGPGQSQVAMRGVSSGQIVRDQPGVKEQVGVYLDESVISLSLFTPDIDLFDLNRVEVLRGPQGTLFGSGSESGTVRYITNQPKIGVTETIGELDGETIDTGGPGGSVKVATNVPISPNAALRFAGYYTRYGGFVDAAQPNQSVKSDVNSGLRAGGRLSFLFKPTDKLTITPRFLYQNLHMNGWNREDVFNILGNPYTTTRPAVQLGTDRIFSQITEPTTDKFSLGDVNLTYDLGGGKTLTSVTSYSNRNILVQRDAGALTSSITGGSIGLPPNVYMLNSPLLDSTKFHQWTEEVHVVGASGPLQWVAGGFYAQNRRHYAQDLPVTGFTAASGIPSASVYAPTDALFWSDLNYKFKQEALFGEATYTVSPKFNVTGGLRWYNFKEDRTQIFDGLFGEGNDGKPQIQPGSAKANGVAPRVIASYKVSDTTRLNAQVSKGFRLGGINDPLNVSLCTAADLATFSGHNSWKDETLWDYEVGSKSAIMNNRGSFNVALYDMEINDLQATVTAGSCSSRLIFSVPKSRSTGAEAEFTLAPTDQFDFSISASHSNAKVRSNVVDGSGNIISGIQSGARMPTVPQDQETAEATYRWTMSAGTAGYATGVFQHIGDRYTEFGDQYLAGVQSLTTFAPNNIGGPYTQNTVTFDPKLPAYNIANARVGILKGRWDVALFVNNIGNEHALLSLDRERGFRARIGYVVNQPRTFGISTRVNY